MENLNDAEFGSNKKDEEAPILVAQRYLNIFRQVHIFNKAKRDQFDDELLALPNNVTDYFKRMPGGRLLVEHIEEVKTERGISFVKSNREDFNYTDASSSSTPNTAPQNAVTQVVGGNVTIDDSFAESLATALASAFKQIQPIQSTGTPAPVSVEFGSAFDVIAEEIRTSRSSLLDVLKETRSITDSVVASQVSISRILESILSSRSREENDVANLNNRIIASQASITKMLESLYTSNNQKNNVISGYFDIEKRLQDFKNEVQHDITESLSRIENLLSNVLVKSSENIASVNHLDTEVAVKSDSDNNNVSDSVITENDVRKKKKKKKKNRNNQLNAEASIGALSSLVTDNPVSHADDYTSSEDESDNTSSAEDISAFSGTIKNSDFKYDDDFSNINLDEPPLDDGKGEYDNLANVFSTDYKDFGMNNFDALSNSDSTVDDLDFVLPEQGISADNNSSDDNEPEYDENFESDGLDFILPEQGSALDNEDDISNNENTSTDDVDDVVTEEEPADDDVISFDAVDDLSDFAAEFDNTEDVVTDDVADVATEEEPTDDDVISFNDVDDLSDFATEFDNTEDTVTDDVTDVETEKEPADDDVISFNDVDDLSDFAAEFDNTEDVVTDDVVTEEGPADDDVISFDAVDDLSDFASEFDNTKDTVTDDVTDVATEKEPADDDVISFNDVDDLSDFATEFDNTEDTVTDDVATEEEPIDDDVSFDDAFENLLNNNNTEETTLSDDISVDSLSSTEGDIEVATETEQQQSRYSAELSKIREALTSDNIDLSSLDKPIALDEYSDDENVSIDETPIPQVDNSANSDGSLDDEEWEWEYVDENGNPVESDGNDEDWEWEYVEEEDQK